MLAISVLSFFYDQLTPLVVLLWLINFPSEVIILRKSFGSVQFKKIRWLLPGIFLGTVAGGKILYAGESSILFTCLGGVIVLFSLYFLFNPQPVRPVAASVPASVSTGVMSGFFAALFSMGGPPVIFYFRLTTSGKSEFRASLLCVFFITGLIRIPVYTLQDMIHGSNIRAALLVLPAVLLGTYLGNHLHINIDERTFKKGISVVLCILGILIILYR
jgi:hypothetical protein